MASDANLSNTIATKDAPVEEARSSWLAMLSWGGAVSLALHLLIAAVLIFNVNIPLPEPTQTPIEVELVPPLEPAPEVEPEAEKAPEEQAVEPEELPEPPEKPEPPEPEVTEEEVPEPAEAPLPPEPAPEQQEAPEPQEQADSVPTTLPVLQPVVEFGDKDGGSEDAPDGNSAEEVESEDLAKPDVTEPDVVEPEPELAGSEEVTAEELETSESEAEQAEVTETEPEEAEAEVAETEAEPEIEDAADAPEVSELSEEPPVEDAAANPSDDADASDPETVVLAEPDPLGDVATDAAPVVEDFGVVGKIETKAAPSPKPPAPKRDAPTKRTAKSQQSPRSGNKPPLARARQLFSRDILGDTRAQTAMNGMPAEQRLNLLCMTELKAQLTNFDPSRPPDMLPSFRPSPGTVLEPGRAAYRSRGVWYDLGFRCKTDQGVRRVETFSFRIGPPIPRSQWSERGLPSF
ncbi:DUF930 domain-containing protein [Roseibium algae]|uniref:DUF930 domain-containing protein n=1 Tax=Roseibium algae TaxID=3123038 RepID=A0ABU8TEN0_9HYPH